MNRKLALSVAAGLALFAFAGLAWSAARVFPAGTRPVHWPAELDPLRARATTVELLAGNWENMYQLFFHDSEEFEKLWPAILSVKSPEAPLRLSLVTRNDPRRLTERSRPSVIIYAPPVGASFGAPRNFSSTDEAITEELNAISKNGISLATDAESIAARVTQEFAEQERNGERLRSGPPWPAYLFSPTGALPEYVKTERAEGKVLWIPSTQGPESGRTNVRARVEIELIVDGKVIDLNRIQFPPDTPIIDQRFDSPKGDNP